MGTTALPAADSLRGQLMRSNSARFLDRMFCADPRLRSLRASVGDSGASHPVRVERRLRRTERAVRCTRCCSAVRLPGRRDRRHRAAGRMDVVRPAARRARRGQACRAVRRSCASHARWREDQALRGRRRRPAGEPRRLGKVSRRHDRRCGRRGLGPGARALDGARCCGHDGDARDGERATGMATRTWCAPCAASSTRRLRLSKRQRSAGPRRQSSATRWAGMPQK